MRWMKWTGVVAGLLLVVLCFMTWVIIGSKNIVVTGVDTSGTNFGKPAYLHFFFTFLFLVFTFIPRIWAKRVNLFVTAFNLAWAVRNYLVVSSCHAGDCPQKQAALYLVIVASALMLASSLFPDLSLPRHDDSAKQGQL